MDTAESASDTGSSLTSVVASVAELASECMFESVVRDMSSKHVIGAMHRGIFKGWIASVGQVLLPEKVLLVIRNQKQILYVQRLSLGTFSDM